jgi:hypothetical protein
VSRTVMLQALGFLGGWLMEGLLARVLAQVRRG